MKDRIARAKKFVEDHKVGLTMTLTGATVFVLTTKSNEGAIRHMRRVYTIELESYVRFLDETNQFEQFDAWLATSDLL